MSLRDGRLLEVAGVEGPLAAAPKTLSPQQVVVFVYESATDVDSKARKKKGIPQ